MHFCRFTEIFEPYPTNFYDLFVRTGVSTKFPVNQGITHFPRLRFSVLWARMLSCGFRGIPENSEFTPICGLGWIFPEVHRPLCSTLRLFCNRLQQTTTNCNTLQHTATHCVTTQHTCADTAILSGVSSASCESLI